MTHAFKLGLPLELRRHSRPIVLLPNSLWISVSEAWGLFRICICYCYDKYMTYKLFSRDVPVQFVTISLPNEIICHQR